jgi:phage terminase large subunit
MNHDNSWVILSLPAVYEGKVHELDPRESGEALWGSRHSIERLKDIRAANPRAFHALYQQDPKPFEGGLVYPKFKTITKAEFDAARGLEAYGLDFGYNEPTAMVHVKLDKPNKKLYIDEKLYRTGLTSAALRQELRKLNMSAGNPIIADSARPEIIQELASAGSNIKPTAKGAGSVYYGILKVLEYEILITNTSKNTLEEIGFYKFKEDRDGNPTNEPLEMNDHAMDAVRYAVRYLSDNQKSSILAYG